MIKIAIFADMYISVAFSVGNALSGSPVVGGAITLVEPTVNNV